MMESLQHQPSQRILLAAGGTGGHVFPAVALGRYLAQQGHQVLLVTDQRGQAYIDPTTEPFQRLVLPFGRLETRGVGALRFLVMYGWSFFKMVTRVATFWPQRVVGYGGFPTLPALLASLFWRRPCYGHEQDTIVSKVNSFLGRCLRGIFMAFPVQQLPPQIPPSKTTVVGMALRPEISVLMDRPYQMPQGADPFNLVVLGGSQGATVFRELVPQAVARLPGAQRSRLRIHQQARPEDHAAVESAYQSLGVTAQVQPFFKDMAGLLGPAHLIISRAGAVSLGEAAAAAVPSILVPLPTAMADHQTKNAQMVAEQGAGWMLAQKVLTPEVLALYLEDLMTHPHKLLIASERLRLFSKKNVVATLASQLLSV